MKVMLSQLKRFTITDEKSGGRAKFADLAVKLLEGDYPQVVYLFGLIDKKKFVRLPWDAVRAIDWKKKQFTVSDLTEAEEVSCEPNADYVLLHEEILDALLLDLQNRRAIRANDLQLEEKDNHLELQATDTGLNPIFRRISLGFYTYVSHQGLHDWKYVEFLRGYPQAVKNGAGYHRRITRLSSGEIAQLTNFIPYLHAAELLTLLPDKQAAKTLEVMPIQRQLQVFEELDEDQSHHILELMASDAAADLVGRLQTDSMKKQLKKLPLLKSQKIVELLRYPENTVGGIMTNDVVYFPADLTVGEARAKFRERFGETDFIYLIYIVSDEENRTLRGRISVRNLLTAYDDAKLEAIMDPYIVTLSSNEAALDAAYRVIGSQLAAMPVIGLNNKLLGAVTIDAAITAITPENNSENLRIFS